MALTASSLLMAVPAESLASAAFLPVSMTSFMTVVGGAPDLVFAQTYTFTPHDGDVFQVYGSPADANSVAYGNTTGGLEDLAIELRPPEGQQLHDGSYYQVADEDTKRQAALTVTDNDQSCSGSGSFDVRDIRTNAAGNIDRLNVTYLQYCGNDNAEVLYGQISINEPPVAPGLLIAPTDVSLPATYPHTLSAVPISIQNVGTKPLTVHSLTVDGSGRTAFEADGVGCLHARLGPTAGCGVDVVFHPTEAGPASATLEINDSAAKTAQRISINGDGVAGHTKLRITTDKDESLGEGHSLTFTPGNADIDAGGDSTFLGAQASIVAADQNPDAVLVATFYPPPGKTFKVGEAYVVNHPNNPAVGPRMAVDSLTQECASPVGTFRIDQLHFRANNELAYLGLTYRQHCAGSTDVETGSFAFHAPRPPAPLPSKGNG